MSSANPADMSTTPSSSPSPSPDISPISSLLNNSKTTTPLRVVAITGAGISTSAGVPDFRSPHTGIYSKLSRLPLPYPEAIFSINYFKHTPGPFYAIARARRPRNICPTISHAFLGLLAKRGLLHKLFTQNIDGLESEGGVPDDKIFAAHGSWKTQRCLQCKTFFPDELMEVAIQRGTVPYCQVPECGGVVKPDIVMFGEALPGGFEEEEKKIAEADLVLVMGTSLKVHPCARLPRGAAEGVPRVLVNREVVGDFGKREGDICILGDCDDGVRKLADGLGWREELEELWGEIVAANEARKANLGAGDDGDESIDDAIDRLARKMKMTVSDGHKRMLEEHLGQKFAGVLPKIHGNN